MFNKVEVINNLSKAISEHFNIEEYSDKHLTIYQHCLDYVLKKIGASTFQNHIKELTGVKSATFRCNLISSIYILRNLKAYVIHRSFKNLSFESTKNRFSIEDSDVQACKQLANFIDGLTFEEVVYKRVCNTKSLDAKLDSIILELKQYCESFVRKKLLFVLRSCNYEIHDLSGELLCKAIATFYHVSIECRSKLYTLNFLRTTCKNHGNNMINYFTAKKRSRLNKVGENEFSLTIVSENQLNIHTENGETVSYDSLSSFTGESDSIMLNVSVQKVISKLEDGKNADKKIRFIRLLMGYYDKSFTDFLYQKGIKYSNDEYIDRIKPSRYTELVAEYLNFDKLRYTKLICSLRKQLA